MMIEIIWIETKTYYIYWTSFLNQHCKVHLFCTSFATLRTVRSILTRSAKISRKKMSIFFTYILGSLQLQCIVTNSYQLHHVCSCCCCYCCYKCKRWFSSPSCLFLRVERSLLEQPEDIDLAQSVFLHLFRKYVTNPPMLLKYYIGNVYYSYF